MTPRQEVVFENSLPYPSFRQIPKRTELLAGFPVGLFQSKKTGDGHPVESIMYGIPLGLMSAALLPFRDKLSFQSAREMKDYVRSFIAGTIVHQAQQGEKKKIVEYYGQNTKRSD